jgi:hypothetical protein
MRLLVPSAAAAIILLGGLGLFLLNATPSIALADVVQAAVKHKLVKYKETQTTTDKHWTVSGDCVMYADLQAPRYREDSRVITLNGAIESVSVRIRDGRKDRYLATIMETVVPDAEKDPIKAASLKRLPEGMFPRKEAALGHVGEGYDPIKKAQPLLESLRELEKHEDAVVTRDKLDGREAVKYHIEEGKRTTRLWVDVKTKLPLRYELRIVDHTPNIPLNQWVYSNFEWDPELEGFKSLDDLFDTTPPEGYKVLDRTQENAR